LTILLKKIGLNTRFSTQNGFNLFSQLTIPYSKYENHID
jgi:hypothetical protein